MNIGRARIVEFLLCAGADPNLADDWGTTPLMEACHHGHAETAAGAGFVPGVRGGASRAGAKKYSRCRARLWDVVSKIGKFANFLQSMFAILKRSSLSMYVICYIHLSRFSFSISFHIPFSQSIFM